MADRELTDDEARALGLERELSDSEVAALGLERPASGFRGAGASGDWGYPDPGPYKAIGTKFIQGTTKGGSDEGVGVLARLKFQPRPGQYLRLPDGSELPAMTPDQIQFAAREYERQNQGAADQHWPKFGFVANTVGEVASDSVLAGKRMVAPIYQSLAGAARGYLGNNSDDPVSKGASTTIGALLGYGAAKTPEWASAASKTRLARTIAESRVGQAAGDAMMSAARWPGEALDRLGIATARRVLSGAKGLKAEEALPDAAVREAMESGAVVPFGTTAGASKRLTAVRESAGDELGRVVADLEQRGVRGPNVMDIYHDLATEGATLGKGTTADAIPNLYQDQAEAIVSKAGDDLQLGLTQANDITRSLQRAAKYGKFEETPLNEAKRAIAARVGQRLKDVVRETGENSADDQVRALAGQFAPLKLRLSRLIPADDHAYQEANRIASRNPFSLWDLAAGGSMFTATQNPVKTAATLGGMHLLRTRGPSTVAWGARNLGNLYLRALEHAPAALAELSAVSARQPAPQDQLSAVRALAAANPAFAQLLESLSRPPAQDEQNLEARRGP